MCGVLLCSSENIELTSSSLPRFQEGCRGGWQHGQRSGSLCPTAAQQEGVFRTWPGCFPRECGAVPLVLLGTARSAGASRAKPVRAARHPQPPRAQFASRHHPTP